MARLLKTQDIYGFRYEGTRFDCGNKAGFQMANLAYAMEIPEIRKQVSPFLRQWMDKN